MSRKRSSDGSNALGGFIFFVILLVVMIPKPVWIFLGVITAVSLVIWIVYAVVTAAEKRRIEAEERARVEQAAQAAAAKRQREEQVRKEAQQRVNTLGKQNAALVESALRAVK